VATSMICRRRAAAGRRGWSRRTVGTLSTMASISPSG
jgi:hypothetical protein